jgi:uncharacterized membrane-anchored protein
MLSRTQARRRLARTGHGLAVAGNGFYLVGSVLYLSEATTLLATWCFVLGSVLAVTSGILPQLVRLWIQPREGEDDTAEPPVAALLGPRRRPAVAVAPT